MIVTSFENLIQEALVQDSGGREAMGGIRDLETFLRTESLQALERRHPGPFAFALFHPKVDLSFKSYIDGGGLGGDLGKKLLFLFFSGEELRFPEPLLPSLLDFGIELDQKVHPVHRLAELLYPSPEEVILPGIVFSGALQGQGPLAYVPLGGVTGVERVAHLCRQVFKLSEKSWGKSESRERYVSHLCGELAAAHISYHRSEGTSFREIFHRALGFVTQHGGDLASVISLV